jgi:hypothetical protein
MTGIFTPAYSVSKTTGSDGHVIEHEFAAAGHDVGSTLHWLPLGVAITL